MSRMIALLRGINVSGNVIFSSAIEDKNALADKIVKMIKERFANAFPISP